MQPNVISLPESIASGKRFVRLPMTSAPAAIRIQIVTALESYLYSNDLSDIISHRIIRNPPLSEAYQMMLASEAVLARDWDQPEEDEAWANL